VKLRKKEYAFDLLSILVLLQLFLVHDKGERNFPPHQLFAFAVGSFFITFVIRNPNSEASFFNITSSLIRHFLFGINERLGTCEIITPHAKELFVNVMLNP